MADIINLRLARKAQRRREAEQAAAENRLRHGRTSGERIRDRTEADRAARSVDGARRDPAATPPEGQG